MICFVQASFVVFQLCEICLGVKSAAPHSHYIGSLFLRLHGGLSFTSPLVSPDECETVQDLSVSFCTVVLRNDLGNRKYFWITYSSVSIPQMWKSEADIGSFGQRSQNSWKVIMGESDGCVSTEDNTADRFC